MIDRTNVAALIPAYREERHIRDVAKRVAVHLDCVMVVDDGSPDGTSAEAKAAEVTVLRHDVNQGKGAAIKSGLRELMKQTGLRYLLLLDGDGQHLPEEIPAFLDEANRSGASMILGNRMSNIQDMPLIRKLTNQTMSWIISLVCGHRIPDSQCGFRMLRADLVPSMFVESNRYDFETEMLIIAARQGCKIVSVPVSTVYGEEQSKIHPLRDTIRFFKLMARYWRSGK